MRVSVVIPTFNRGPLLERALASVINQSELPLETLVVDDGSTDDTAQRVAEHFPTVRLIRQENLGVSAARNRGIREASGEWIAFLDSDDEWMPDKLRVQGEAIAANPGTRVCHTDEIWIRNGRRVNPMRKHAKPNGHIFRSCLPLCCMSPSTIMIQRDVFADAGTFDPEMPACEDYDLWLRICARYPVLLVPEPVSIRYGGHADQLSRQHWGMDRFRIHALEKVLAENILDAGDRAAALDVLREKIEIVAAGARKRGNDELARSFEEKLDALSSTGRAA